MLARNSTRKVKAIPEFVVNYKFIQIERDVLGILGAIGVWKNKEWQKYKTWDRQNKKIHRDDKYNLSSTSSGLGDWESFQPNRMAWIIGCFFFILALGK